MIVRADMLVEIDGDLRATPQSRAAVAYLQADWPDMAQAGVSPLYAIPHALLDPFIMSAVGAQLTLVVRGQTR